MSPIAKCLVTSIFQIQCLMNRMPHFHYQPFRSFRMKISKKPARFTLSRSLPVSKPMRSRVEPVEPSLIRPLPSKYKKTPPTPIIPSFKQLGLRGEVFEALYKGPLKDIGPSAIPTDIQALAIPRLLQGKSIVCASHTGSGKTLAYLLPLISKLKQQEADNDSKPVEEQKAVRRLNKPRGIIIVPSRELVLQVLKVGKELTHIAKIRFLGVCHATPWKEVKSALNNPLDILVTTPGSILKLIKSEQIQFSDINYAVYDEADSLFETNFQKDLYAITEKIQQHHSGCQFAIVTATLSKKLMQLMEKNFPGIEHVASSNLHKALPNVKHYFLTISKSGGNKHAILMQLLKANQAENFLVFCNTRKACQAVVHYLRSANIGEILALHGDITDQERDEQLQKLQDSEKAPFILVSTDIASRGLDTTIIDHVVLFDFPRNTIDYLHRAGRTGRALTQGKVTSFVGRKDKLLANEIKTSIIRRLPL